MGHMGKNGGSGVKKISSHKALQYLQHLESDVQNYNVWLRTLMCAVVEGPQQDSAEICALNQGYDFGQWFYGEEGVSLRSLDAYAKIARCYNSIQEMAEQMRRQLCGGKRITGEEVSVFMDQANVFRKHVAALEMEVKEHLCAIDPLTGVYNRHVMMQRLEDEHQRALRNGHRCALVLMDLDHFKNINDLYGHNVGDRALRESAEIVADSLRDYDSMYRFGGEEFLICLPYLDAKRAKIAAERLRNRLRSQSIRVGKDLELQITASFGASLLDSTASLEDSISRADQALYVAKHGGRDRVEIWTE